MNRLMLSGAAGFLGDQLLGELAAGWELVGVDRQDRPAHVTSAWHRTADEADGLAAAVEEIRPSLVVHAAFINRKDPSWSDEEYLGRQQTINLRLFERCARLEARLLLISSSAVYGPGASSSALDEQTPRRPVSLYGLAKIQQEHLAEYVARTRGLELSTVRLFNLIGPGKGGGTVLHDWAAKVAAIAGGGEPVLRVRNRATSRDFVDVRDAARAIRLVADRFVPSEIYNVATGRAVGLRELSDELASLSPVEYRVEETDPGIATDDAPFQVGDASKIADSHGWRPSIDWRRSVREVLEGYLSTPAGSPIARKG